MHKTVLGLLAAASLSGANTAHAAIVTYNFTATVESLTDDTGLLSQAGIANGSTLTGAFSYDDVATFTSADVTPSGDGSSRSSSNISGTIAITGLAVQGPVTSASTFALTETNHFGSNGDTFRILTQVRGESADAPSVSVNGESGYTRVTSTVTLESSADIGLDGTAIPSQLASLGAFDAASRVSFVAEDGTSSSTLRARFTSLTLASAGPEVTGVPELDPGSTGAAVTIVSIGVALLSERRKAGRAA